MDNQIKVNELLKELNRRAARAVVGQLGFRKPAASNYLSSLFEGLPGEDGSFLADPVFEATFGWQEADMKMSELKGTLISDEVLKALSSPPTKPEDLREYAFPLDRRPYVHQLTAWKTLLNKDTKSVLVTSGTGSGKTECFLVPIIEDLYTEYKMESVPLTGVRALFLYPLNALINSQRERLKAWTHHFDGGVRFSLFNGETPNKRTKASIMIESPEEVRDRTILRENPPPMLVTNSTMLEYMLVRNEDAPIVEQSNGKLRWIVLDEIHTYIGSQAAELALLLRRVMDSFGVKAEDVRFVATSATVGSGDESSTEKLQKFLADVAGVNESKVQVIKGRRSIPQINEKPAKQLASLEELTEKSPQEQFDELCGYAPALKIRKILAKPPHAASTTDLIRALEGVWQDNSKESVWKLMDRMAAGNDGNSSFLPIRAHIFQKTLDGIYACTNSVCSDMPEMLKGNDWKYGRIYLSERDYCHCGAPVQPIISCNSCGQEYLEAEEHFNKNTGNYEILHPTRRDDEDEFLWDIELDEKNEQFSEIEREGSPGKEHVILHHRGSQNLVPVRIQNKTRQLTHKDGDIVLYGQSIDEAVCITCGAKDRIGWKIFMPKRLGAPFFLGDSLPTLLEHSPKHGDGPFDSRRLLTFTDSRQGTARMAARLQQDVDRNKVRSVLYHSVHVPDDSSQSDSVEDLRKEIIVLEEAQVPSLEDLLKKKKYQLAELESSSGRVLRWGEVAESLNNSVDVSRYMFDAFQNIASTYISREQFGDFCLYREFMRRPIRGFQMETLGLIDMHYPDIDSLSSFPKSWEHLYADQNDKKENAQQDWKNWLTILIDIFLRGNSAVNFSEPWGKLMGAKVHRKYIVGPRDSRDQFVLRWPSARRSTKSKPVALLIRGFRLDAGKESVLDQLEQVLDDSWIEIKGKVLSPQDENRFLLNLRGKAVFRKLNTGWKCPYNHRIVSRLFRGQSPNTPARDLEALECKPIELPDMPYPHETDHSNRLKIVEWLESDPLLLKLREMGVWPNRADRIATGEPWFRIEEHSAQIDSRTLKKYEKLFKDGKLNVLSCSTTMEMGVDIGGMSVVAMNNVPPHPANYMQRAGRAGRRKESTSISYTLCKSSAHSMQVFNEPKWPFLPGQIEAPRISLESRNIVQRHINALLLSYWLRKFDDDIPKLTSGWFMEKEEDGIAVVDKFISWCRSMGSQPEFDQLSNSVASIVRKTAISSKTLEQLATESALVIERVYLDWWNEFGSMLEELHTISKQSRRANEEPAYKAVDISLNRMRGEYLLRDLANSGFLPGYGFPTHVVSLNSIAIRDLKKPKTSSREDSFGSKRGGPSRDLAVALREYAPGAEIVIKGLVYRSAGITLNWHRPSNLEAAPEIQNLYNHWECRKCGDFGDIRKYPSQCPSCDADSSKLEVREVLEPAGFSVDLYEDPHTNVNQPVFMPYEDAKVAAVDASWRTLPNNLLGKIRYSENGLVSHISSGMHGNGYTLCLCCGRAEPQFAQGEAAKPVAEEHKRLRGGKGANSGSSLCEGPSNAYMIRKDLYLASKIRTSVFELQLKDPRNEFKPVQDSTVAWTIGFVLRNTLTKRLGVDQREVEVAVRDIRFEDDLTGFSLCLYDTASQGAGYVERLQEDLISLMKNSMDRLECPASCDSVCQHCLLDNSSQYKENHLNREVARAWLAEWLKSCEIPEDKRYFGRNSSVSLSSLPYQIELLLREQRIDRVQLFLEISDDDPAILSHWFMLDVTQRLMANHVDVEWILTGVDADEWKARCGNQLAGMIEMYAGKLFVSYMSVKNELNGAGKMIMAAVSENGGKYWAGENAILALSENWGTLDGPVVTTANWVTTLDFPTKQLDVESLRPTDKSASSSVRVRGELDGNTSEFGSRFFAWLNTEHSLLSEKIKGKTKLKEITYSDRYIRSPLHVILISQIISAILKQCGDSGTKINISSIIMPRSEKRPYKLFHNFVDTNERDEILNLVVSSISSDSLIKITDHPSQISHARTLTLHFYDSESFEIDFDQGMGAWSYYGNNWDAYADTNTKVGALLKDRGSVRISGKWGTLVNIRKGI